MRMHSIRCRDSAKCAWSIAAAVVMLVMAGPSAFTAGVSAQSAPPAAAAAQPAAAEIDRLIQGEIQSITVTDMSNPSSGGSMVVAGKRITIADKLLIGLSTG